MATYTVVVDQTGQAASTRKHPLGRDEGRPASFGQYTVERADHSQEAATRGEMIHADVMNHRSKPASSFTGTRWGRGLTKPVEL